ncbi:hypothetical protein DFH06DRAFT_1149657 [Mycena polygramma]|nr:hypothetical protein DFH06DRAFT_1149657 [Mycena polygramma]
MARKLSAISSATNFLPCQHSKHNPTCLAVVSGAQRAVDTTRSGDPSSGMTYRTRESAVKLLDFGHRQAQTTSKDNAPCLPNTCASSHRAEAPLRPNTFTTSPRAPPTSPSHIHACAVSKRNDRVPCISACLPAICFSISCVAPRSGAKCFDTTYRLPASGLSTLDFAAGRQNPVPPAISRARGVAHAGRRRSAPNFDTIFGLPATVEFPVAHNWAAIH